MTSLLVSLVVISISGYILLLLIIYWYQARLLYIPGDKDFRGTPSDVGLSFEEIQLTTADQVILHGWLITVDNPRGVILFCHGNAGNISHRLGSLKLFAKLGFSILIFDYRGYGVSGGKTTEEGTYLDAKAAYDHLVDRLGIDPKRIVVFGHSMGAAIASHLASQHQCGAVILESAFTSVPELGRQLYPYLPVILLSRFSYNSAANVKKIVYPILIAHSPDDEIIPFSHGQKLFQVSNEPKYFLQMNGGHNDGFYVNGEVYFDDLNQFLSQAITEPL